MADRAFLASIGRINKHYRHASNGRLVVYELPELIEAPVMLFASLSLLNRASLSDALKIFKGIQEPRLQHRDRKLLCEESDQPDL